MSSDGPSDELQEVEEELEKKKGEGNESDDEDIEAAPQTTSKKQQKQNAAWCKLGVESAKVFTQVCLVFNYCVLFFLRCTELLIAGIYLDIFG